MCYNVSADHSVRILPVVHVPVPAEYGYRYLLPLDPSSHQPAGGQGKPQVGFAQNRLVVSSSNFLRGVYSYFKYIY